MVFRFRTLSAALLTFLISQSAALQASSSQPAQAPIPVKVVVVAMFELGNDTGDRPGELQYWVERDHLDHVYEVPAAYHSVRMNDRGEMAILTGAGTAHAAATLMAVGQDPRFDFSHAYWIIAGISGGNPKRVSLGSAVWANWVVDGDLAYEIDEREIPKNWPTGYVPLRKTIPFERPAEPTPNQVFELNHGLEKWAYRLTKDIPLADDEKLRAIRGNYDGKAAQLPPIVTEGDEISSSTFWHGKLLDKWADEWITYFTNGQGHFATTAMEDTGTLLSIDGLAAAGKADGNRVLVLRTISNFDQQPRGLDAATSLARQRLGSYSAYMPSLEAAYTVGHTVVNELLTHWSRYSSAIPSAQ
ncbi:MAG: purine nucleoside permease [Acidobacteriota bacterium]|nr:purine nucleoside permease [Acidobacteriota bacterium]